MSFKKKESKNLPSLIESVGGRRQLRYWCFRFCSEADGGNKATGAPSGLKKAVESLPSFKFCSKGWSDFGVRWDWSEESPFEIIPLEESLLDAWHEECRKNAKELPASVQKAMAARKAVADARAAVARESQKEVTDQIIDVVLRGGNDPVVTRRKLQPKSKFNFNGRSDL